MEGTLPPSPPLALVLHMDTGAELLRARLFSWKEGRSLVPAS